MEKIRVLIVDDEELARDRIRRLVRADDGLEVVGECGDGAEAVDMIKSTSPDLVFLDVQMPELSGFQVLESLEPDRIPLVVFATAHEEHAVKAFEVHALDYLLKPFDDDRFRDALQRAKGQLAGRKTGEVVHRILEMLGETRPGKRALDRIIVKTGGRIAFVKTEEIDWIEAQGDYVCLHCQGKKHLVREKISDLEERLPSQLFVRIHRSTIVNTRRIREMQPLYHGDYAVLLHDGTRLVLSRSFREKAFQSLTSTSSPRSTS